MRIVVGLCGASGAVYARRTLALLAAEIAKGRDLSVAWVATATAEQVWRTELGEAMPAGFAGLQRWGVGDFSAPFASGSNAADATLLMPCSASRLAKVATGSGDDLISRACDVALKERRRLLLVVRETPLSLVHLRNMSAATEAGAIVMPASPSFYAGVTSLEAAVDSVVLRALDLVGIALPLLPRWGADTLS